MAISPELIDPEATKVVRRLHRYGHTAYLVGGCVRDLLLLRRPKDFDVATSAKPEEIKRLFRNCRIIGRRFRLAHIFFGPKIIETSTFRTHPREGLEPSENETVDEELLIRRDNVFGTAEEDARRRDFTINGLFYNLETGEVIDYVQGRSDLEHRLVRTIGDPDIRFREDPVRILRAVKFASRLGFAIEPITYQAMLAHRGEIPKCAPARVLEELYRLLRGGAAGRAIELLEETGILELLVPALVQALSSTQVATDGEEAAVAADGPAQPTPRVRLGQLLGALDGRALEDDRSPSNALLLGVLLLPLLPELLETSALDRPGNVDHLEQISKPILTQMKASRRDTALARQILMAQRRLAPSARRRGRARSLVSRDYFADALELFSLAARAGWVPLEEEQEWSRLRSSAERRQPGTEPGEPEPRRRRRRRRKRRGGTGGLSPTTTVQQS